MEKLIPYEIDGRKLEGMLAWDERVKGPRPGMLLQCDWKGVCPETVAQARTIGKDKYFVFMADMRGVGFGARAKTFEELMKTARALRADYPLT